MFSVSLDADTQLGDSERTSVGSVAMDPLPPAPPTATGHLVFAAAQQILTRAPALGQQPDLFAQALADALPPTLTVLVRRVHGPQAPRTAQPMCPSPLSRLAHTYVVVRPAADSPAPSPCSRGAASVALCLAQQSELVVEPQLAALLAVPGARPALRDLLAQHLPPGLVVAGRVALARALRQVAAALEVEYWEQGRPLPPWRSAAALLGRWLSPCALDCPVAPSPPTALQPPATPDAMQHWATYGLPRGDSSSATASEGGGRVRRCSSSSSSSSLDPLDPFAAPLGSSPASVLPPSPHPAACQWSSKRPEAQAVAAAPPRAFSASPPAAAAPQPQITIWGFNPHPPTADSGQAPLTSPTAGTRQEQAPPSPSTTHLSTLVPTTLAAAAPLPLPLSPVIPSSHPQSGLTQHPPTPLTPWDLPHLTHSQVPSPNTPYAPQASFKLRPLLTSARPSVAEAGGGALPLLHLLAPAGWQQLLPRVNTVRKVWVA
ncbi:hypothetical protein V8C86DRAFT_2911490 [Haematococcus lacustris]